MAPWGVSFHTSSPYHPIALFVDWDSSTHRDTVVRLVPMDQCHVHGGSAWSHGYVFSFPGAVAVVLFCDGIGSSRVPFQEEDPLWNISHVYVHQDMEGYLNGSTCMENH